MWAELRAVARGRTPRGRWDVLRPRAVPTLVAAGLALLLTVLLLPGARFSHPGSPAAAGPATGGPPGPSGANMGLSGPAGPDGAAPDAAAGPGAHTTAPGAAVPGAGPAAPGDAAHTRPDAGPPDLGRADAGARTGAAGEATGQLAASAPMTVRYTFEAGSARTMRDTGGHYQLRVVAAAGGSIAFLRRGNGWAARFPDRCTGPAAGCPRAILESSRPDLFNPGTRPIRYGAAVLMTRRDTAPGANVLQKGYSTDGGSQYKLQVDGAAGRPSCVVADARRTIYRVTSPVSVADGRWHDITCARSGGSLAITVDGVTTGRRIPAGLSLVNRHPLRIGGKSVGVHNDQFAGQIDSVFVSIS